MVGFNCSLIAGRNTKKHSSIMAFDTAEFLDTTAYKRCTVSFSAELRCHRPADPQIVTLILARYLSKNGTSTNQAELLYSPSRFIH